MFYLLEGAESLLLEFMFSFCESLWWLELIVSWAEWIELDWWEAVFEAFLAPAGDLSECLLLPNTTLLKFWNAIITTVTLSNDYLYKLFLSMLSTASPDYWCTFYASFLSLLSMEQEFQTHAEQSSFESLSKIPSHPRIMKSCSLPSLKEVTSGMQATTFGLPPLKSYFASGSPKVRETESRPGSTRIGPTI